MDLISMLFAGLFYSATAFAVTGTGHRLWCYWRTPIGVAIPLAPAPRNRREVCARLFLELVLFRSLFRANRWTWLFSWLFHVGFLILVLVHLRFFMLPAWGWVYHLQAGAGWASSALLGGLTGLLLRRVLVERVRYISTPADYAMLLLLLGIGVTGWLMNNQYPVNQYQVLLFARGLVVFDWQPLPSDPLIYLHLTLVLLLLFVFPISKLIHAPGVWFSPTFTQRDPHR